jgi:putative ABC transport system substrate-binding protein
VRAQQPMPVVGFLHPGYANLVAVFRKGLSETGYVDGQNVTIEYRWAHNDNRQLPGLAADLVRRRVAVIVTPIGTASAVVAKAATTTIPIIFSTGTDPVQAGLVAALNRPGGNVTGIVSLSAELGAKRLGLLQELLPGAARFAVLVNPNNPVATETLIKDAQAAAATIGRKIEVVSAGTTRDIDTAFASLVQKRVDALMVGADPMFLDRRVQLATLAARYMLPAIGAGREFADAGILMSYGASNTDRYRHVGIYTGRILKGEKPADLPVTQSTKFEFVINLQTARALGLEVPPTLIARGDEVIE